MKFVLFFSLSLFLSNVGFSQNTVFNGTALNLQLNTITTAVPFLRIGPDARAAGMGDAGIAISPDANSIYWNSSKLVFSQSKTGFSTSYSPWLQNLVSGIHHAYLSGYSKLGERHVLGGGIRSFILGNVNLFGPSGNIIQQYRPREFEFTIAYAFKLTKRSALGINAKYVYSNLTSGISTGTVGIKPGVAGAVDLSYSYINKDLKLFENKTTWSFGTVLSNMGNKIAYTVEGNRDFIPTNLGIGTALKVDFNESHSLSSSFDFNKLLVPTPPIKNTSGNIVSGQPNDVSALVGMIQSFYDAPGSVVINSLGQPTVEKNSRFVEELNEITIGGGFEYLYHDILALRAGYFHQHKKKGNGQYFTFGAGVFYKFIGLDLSYLAHLDRTNPLANTFRFTLKCSFPSRNGI